MPETDKEAALRPAAFDCGIMQSSMTWIKSLSRKRLRKTVEAPKSLIYRKGFLINNPGFSLGAL